MVSDLRVAATKNGPSSRAAAVVERLRTESAEFVGIWDRHDVTSRGDGSKIIAHPQLGNIELTCQILFTQDHGQALLVFTALPGSESHSKLQMLSVIGTQVLTRDPG